MSRHKQVVATARVTEAETIALTSPAPGLFRTHLRVGDIVRGGSVLGELEVLGHLSQVLAPDAATGAIIALADPQLTRPAVEFGGTLVTIDPRAIAGAATTDASGAASHGTAGGLVFRAPTSGRFYGRPSPDKPAFVSAGGELAPGATICLLEVMKTFHRVTYGGAGLPERAKVREVLVADGDDVNAGDPLLALDPAI